MFKHRDARRFGLRNGAVWGLWCWPSRPIRLEWIVGGRRATFAAGSCLWVRSCGAVRWRKLTTRLCRVGDDHRSLMSLLSCSPSWREGGPALEFAVGTGRVALPLSARGIAVHGIELSPHMAEQLRTKPSARPPPTPKASRHWTCAAGAGSLTCAAVSS